MTSNNAAAASPVANDRPKWLVFAILIGLATITFAVFSQTTRFSFLNYDDSVFISGNEKLAPGLTWHTLNWALKANLTKQEPDAEYWEPLTLISRLADVQFFGLNAGGHHLTSVILHLIAGFMLFGAMNALFHSPIRAGFIAALFLIHPLHVEPVAWLAARKDVLNGLFYFATIWAYAWYAASPRWSRYLLVCASFIAANMAKPMAVSLPLVLLLLDYWPLQRIKRPWTFRSCLRLGLEKAPLVVISAGVCLVTIVAQKNLGAMGDETLYPISGRFGNAAISFGAYLGQTFIPVGLSAVYPHPGNAVNWPLAAVSAGVCLLTTFLCLLQAERRPWLIVGWAWFIVVLLPVSGIVQVGELSRADRYTYVALTGIFILCLEQTSEWVQAWQRRFGNLPAAKTLTAAGACLILGIAGVLAWKQTATWRDSITVFTRALAVTDDNYIAEENLGAALFEAGQKEEGFKHYAESLRLQAPKLEHHRSAGAEAARRGDLQAAIFHFTKVITVLPADAESHRALGDLLFKSGDLSKALVQYNEVLHYERGDMSARLHIAQILIADHQLSQARALLDAMLHKDPANTQARQLLDSLPPNTQ